MYRKTYAVFSLDVELDIILQCRRLQLAGSAFGNEVLRGCLVLCTKGFHRSYSQHLGGGSILRSWKRHVSADVMVRVSTCCWLLALGI